MVRLRDATAERTERRVVDELRLFDDAERGRRRRRRRRRHAVAAVVVVVGGRRRVAPEEEVVVVDDAPAEVALTQLRDVVGVVLVGERTHEPVTQARLAGADDALLGAARRRRRRRRRHRQADDGDVERPAGGRLRRCGSTRHVVAAASLPS